MELTFIGYAQLLIGAFVIVAGNLRHALLLLMVSSLFNGSAALLLPALGDSSIPPVQLALAFLVLRILIPGSAAIAELPGAIKANRWLALFAFYGIATAIIMPRMFAGAVNVYPMLFQIPDVQFASVPLGPTAQNLTAAFYMLGTFLTALTVWVACRRVGAAQTLVSSMTVLAWAHLLLGLAGVVLRDTPADTVLELFRNSAYLQLDDQVEGFVRIRGIFPEASAYAAFGFVLFVTNAELWYHSIRSLATGRAALAMGLVLFFSTSSTAYVALAAYAVFFGLRMIALPGIADGAKGRAALAVMGMLVVVAAIVSVASPALIDSIGQVIASMTIEKSSSYSGLQRLYWTRQGWELFLSSYGLGVGPGSFRSSSTLFAILGSMGVIGIISFVMYVVSVFQPGRRSTWGASPSADENLGGALGSAALLSLIPAMVNSATAVPGTSFAILAGASLALRPTGVVRRAVKRGEMHARRQEEVARPEPQTRQSTSATNG